MKVDDLISNFNPLYIEDLKQKDHPSAFVHNDSYQMLIVRQLYLKKVGLEDESSAYIFFKEEIYFYNKESDELHILDGNLSELYERILAVYEQNRAIIEEYVDEIDLLEDKIYERDMPRSFMDTWFDIKKDMLKIERYYQKNLNVIRDFYKFKVAKNNILLMEFKDLEESANLNLSKVTGQLSRLDGIYRYYESVKQERLSKNIYFLTVLSAIFLPLNLVVGFFGMNTNGLFFKNHPMGTNYVLYMLIGVFIFAVVGLKLIRVIDHYIFNKALGRYNIYRKISKRLEELLDND